MTHGILLSFTAIPRLSGVVFLACGPNHMLAIQDKVKDHQRHSHEKFDGSTYAWGFNQKGQLGIGNLQDQTSPCKILTTEKFHKVACG
jgi:alpha-tubulin suppressor-like RCC1 family protein